MDAWALSVLKPKPNEWDWKSYDHLDGSLETGVSRGMYIYSNPMHGLGPGIVNQSSVFWVKIKTSSEQGVIFVPWVP